MEDRLWWQGELERAVERLSSDAETQIEWLRSIHKSEGPVIADELALELEDLWLDGRHPGLEWASPSPMLRSNIEALDRTLDSMSGGERADLWTEEALRSRPEWDDVRILAAQALSTLRREFGVA
jgi:hypothetical protein